MAIIALYTDFGYAGWFAGLMKGVILGIAPSAVIIDVTHSIESFDILEAAFVLEWSYSYFPEGTIHLTITDPGVGGKRRAVIVKSGGHFFVAPDNGTLSKIFEADPDAQTYCVSNDLYFLPQVSSTFHGRDIFAPVSAHLANGTSIEQIGHRIYDPVILNNLNPLKLADDAVEGEIITIDKFGNLITNIRPQSLPGDCIIDLPGKHIRFYGLNRSYSEVFAGDPLAIAGSTGYLEIAVNQGNASKTLSMSKGDKIRVYTKQH